MCRILWIDNHASTLDGHAAVLRKHGVDVELVEDAEYGLSLLKNGEKFDLLILDLRLQEGLGLFKSDHERNKTVYSGIDVINQLRDNQIKIPICVLSSYLQLDEFKQSLQEYDIPGVALDKYVEELDSDGFRIHFVEPILEIARKSERDRLGTISEAFKKQKISNNVSPFSISYDRYLRLSKREQESVRMHARALTKPVRAKAFSEGAIWILIVGSRENIVASARTPDQVWNSERVKNAALELNRVPFQFERSTVSDDAWPICEGTRELSSYPVIRLRPAEGSTQAEWLVHFDTGTWESYFCLEEFMQLGRFRDYADLIDAAHRDQIISFRREKIKFVIKDSANGGTIVVNADVKLVQNWHSSSFRAPCPETCSNAWGARRYMFGNCVHRVGLIGRSIFVEHDLKVMLRARGSEVYVERESDEVGVVLGDDND